MHRLTYLNDHLKNGRLIRWPDQCFPLKVYIAPCTFYSLSDVDKYAYMGMVREALRIWESIGDRKFSFTIVNSLNESNMNIEWRRVDRKSLGNCSFCFDNDSRLYSAEVSIGISDGILHSKYMDENEVFHTILHEIGHALGLGHSTNTADIMYTPHQYGVTNLSKRDIQTVRWLYTLPYGTSVDGLNEAYSLSYKNIDDIIMHLVNERTESNFHKTMKTIKVPQRNLQEEQDKLAQIKKYHMSIQNIKLPKEIADKFKER